MRRRNPNRNKQTRSMCETTPRPRGVVLSATGIEARRCPAYRLRYRPFDPSCTPRRAQSPVKSSPVTSRILLSLSALACGAIAVLAFSPFGYWPLVIPSLLGLYAMLDKATPKQAAWRGFGYAMGLFLPGLWWIHVSMTEFGGIPLPVAFVLLAGLSAYLALYPTLACWAFARNKSPRAG